MIVTLSAPTNFWPPHFFEREELLTGKSARTSNWLSHFIYYSGREVKICLAIFEFKSYPRSHSGLHTFGNECFNTKLKPNTAPPLPSSHENLNWNFVLYSISIYRPSPCTATKCSEEIVALCRGVISYEVCIFYRIVVLVYSEEFSVIHRGKWKIKERHRFCKNAVFVFRYRGRSSEPGLLLWTWYSSYTLHLHNFFSWNLSWALKPLWWLYATIRTACLALCGCANGATWPM